eukprot:GHVR01119260.1.p1 GENE.GHVR01119260.1~~GHVR01119260.1.p1  ORF type:complete len:149 (-),score=31.63 GHVR01119260.1:152-598(-)
MREAEGENLVEKEETAKRLAILQREEALETQKESVRSVSVFAYLCEICLRWSVMEDPVCVQKGHTQTVKKALKEFWQCECCLTRVLSFNGFKTCGKLCPKCGGTSFTRVSAYECRKKGAELISDGINARGDEWGRSLTNINSMKTTYT